MAANISVCFDPVQRKTKVQFRFGTLRISLNSFNLLCADISVWTPQNHPERSVAAKTAKRGRFVGRLEVSKYPCAPLMILSTMSRPSLRAASVVAAPFFIFAYELVVWNTAIDRSNVMCSSECRKMLDVLFVFREASRFRVRKKLKFSFVGFVQYPRYFVMCFYISQQLDDSLQEGLSRSVEQRQRHTK